MFEINEIITVYTSVLATFTLITLSGINSETGREFFVFTILNDITV